MNSGVDSMAATVPAEAGAPSARTFGLIPALVWAFRFHEDGSVEELAVDGPIEDYRDGWLWLHLNLADARAAQWLASAELPTVAVLVLRTHDTHQQMHVADDCIYGIFSDLIRNLEKATGEIAYLRFVMTERLLVSGRHHSLSSVEAAHREVARGARRLPNVAALLELIVEQVVDAIDGFTDELSREIDAIEDGLLAERVTDERRRLDRLRRTSVRLHRQLSGLRTLFHRLEREGVEHLKPPLRLAAGRLVQRLDALDHSVIEMRDRARMLQDEIGGKMVEETNNHLHVLSILTMLFLPPTLITGVFGMNVKGLPSPTTKTHFFWQWRCCWCPPSRCTWS